MVDKENADAEGAKERADVPPVFPNERDSTADAGGALSPSELDITDSPYVEQLDDEGRYVVSSGDKPPNVPGKTTKPDVSRNPGGRPADRGRGGQPRDARGGTTDPNLDRQDGAGFGARNPSPEMIPRSPEAARSVLADELQWAQARYAFDIVSQFGDETVYHRTTSNHVVESFEELVFWYARQVSGNTPASEAISVLLSRSEFTVPITETQVRRIASRNGLDEEDSIEDLLEALD